jgi:hypothetical protein
MRLEVLEPPGALGYQFTGPYRLQVVAVDRAPEGLPAAYAVGDTVTEAIATIGDWDEYSATGAPGETLQLSSCLTAAAVPPGTGLNFHVVDPATGQIILGSGATVIGLTCFPEPWTFTVPAGGSFIIRVRPSRSLGNGMTTAPYRFNVRR